MTTIKRNNQSITFTHAKGIHGYIMVIINIAIVLETTKALLIFSKQYTMYIDNNMLFPYFDESISDL
ncbi:uncharacterized protein RHIMIDRAFT_267661 [Rhizopus microsporus ATCC 52813]|uniref:Transmembrane protein n=1 Tax=Rhizopus microsporus ATCC 52813 TaxID=1340429 RepID=A0A2G4SJ11_RHIZD|nr:uncharacterized protein RHIMIDRAFT_267661 [Rhizopus microsporus ATCC 52813]PHZ08754.1 hypothetical protein RHIMIDRAFT_267661 [Rhizopus microsporus ATCC 52813]